MDCESVLILILSTIRVVTQVVMRLFRLARKSSSKVYCRQQLATWHTFVICFGIIQLPSKATMQAYTGTIYFVADYNNIWSYIQIFTSIIIIFAEKFVPCMSTQKILRFLLVAGSW